MPDIKYIPVQVGPNRIIEGFYVIDGNLLTMTYQDGEPVILFEGSEAERKVIHILAEGENERSVASKLTREIRKIMAGEIVPGFTGPIEYRNGKVA